MPAGQARLRVTHAGFVPASEEVPVAAGAVARRDIYLTIAAGGGRTVVKLDEFVIAASREMSRKTKGVGPLLVAAIKQLNSGNTDDLPPGLKVQGWRLSDPGNVKNRSDS